VNRITLDREPLTPPFPWFGGKRTIAPMVWQAFGDVSNYVEPFAGALAVLLGRPVPFDGVETINDSDGFIVNAWRALADDAVEVARWVEYPAHEIDLHARHRWLAARRDELTARLHADPHYYDAEIAGWWLWGIALWVGQGWCPTAHAPRRGPLSLKSRPRGVMRLSFRAEGVGPYLARLQARLRHVRIACGDWSRVCTPSATTAWGITGVFLDPPYPDDTHDVTYSGGNGDASARAYAWAVRHGRSPLLRVVFCTMEGAHPVPEGWTAIRWERNGYHVTDDARDAARREIVMMSPGCQLMAQPSLFDE